jgi:ATP-dependent Clp protease adaptor protein ClpS
MQFETTTVLEPKTQRSYSPYWRVVGHNDDVTTMDYVVMILMDIFHKEPEEAFKIMLLVHESDSATFYFGTREACELKLEMVQHSNERNAQNLAVSMEPVEQGE